MPFTSQQVPSASSVVIPAQKATPEDHSLAASRTGTRLPMAVPHRSYRIASTKRVSGWRARKAVSSAGWVMGLGSGQGALGRFGTKGR